MLLALAAFGWSGDAAACTLVVPDYVTESPPAHLTDPADIAAWQREQEQALAASLQIEQERLWRERKVELALEASRAEDLPTARLAEDLAEALVPPPHAQIAWWDSCDRVDVPVRDPAGYVDRRRSGNNRELAEHLVAIGLIAEPAELDLVPARLLRDLSFGTVCIDEAAQRVSMALAARFTVGELAHVWSTLHRLDFNLHAAETGRPGYMGWRPRGYRVLRFADVRSGPLVFSDHARPNDFAGTASPVIAAGQSADTAELRRFFASDGVALRVVDTVETELAGDSLERCPKVAADIAAKAVELRAQIAQRRRAQARAEPPAS